MKMKLCRNWRSLALRFSFIWALRLVLLAPIGTPAGSLLFTTPPQLTNGGYLLRLSSPTGRVFQVQASTDLTHWTSIATLTSSTGQAEVLDTNTVSSAHRFYRAVAPLSYRLTVIEPPPGYTGASAGAMNSAGQVAGSLLDSNSFDTVFFWDAGQTIVLPLLPGFSSGVPLALSDTASIVGWSGTSTATLWTRNDDGSFAVMDLNSLLPPDLGLSLDQAEAISPDGRFIAAGYPGPTPGVRGRAILEIDSAGALVSAKDLGLGCYVNALRVDNGILKMTGSRTNGAPAPPYVTHAFLWEGPASPFNLDSGQFFDLNPPGSVGKALNSKGQIAGYGGSGPSLALFWDENRQLVNMFSGKNVSGVYTAFGINDAGYVVGGMSPDLSYYQAFLWHNGAPFQTLISLKSPSDTSGVSVLNGGISINNSGQILAHGQYQAGNGDISVLMNPE